MARVAVPEPVEVFSKLRTGILQMEPGQIGIHPGPQVSDTWGVLMEIGYPERVVTLMALADGSASLYYGSGGGVIGAGDKHESVREAAQILVAESGSQLAKLAPAQATPLPDVGWVRFYALTFSDTIYTAEAPERELAAESHALSSLYSAGHEILTQMRLLGMFE